MQAATRRDVCRDRECDRQKVRWAESSRRKSNEQSADQVPRRRQGPDLYRMMEKDSGDAYPHLPESFLYLVRKGL